MLGNFQSNLYLIYFLLYQFHICDKLSRKLSLLSSRIRRVLAVFFVIWLLKHMPLDIILIVAWCICIHPLFCVIYVYYIKESEMTAYSLACVGSSSLLIRVETCSSRWPLVFGLAEHRKTPLLSSGFMSAFDRCLISAYVLLCVSQAPPLSALVHVSSCLRHVCRRRLHGFTYRSEVEYCFA